MTQVSVAEFRKHLPQWLKRVEAGEDVALTRRGKPVARLSATDDTRERARRFFEEIRGKTYMGDVISPTGEEWEADLGRL